MLPTFDKTLCFTSLLFDFQGFPGIVADERGLHKESSDPKILCTPLHDSSKNLGCSMLCCKGFRLQVVD